MEDFKKNINSWSPKEDEWQQDSKEYTDNAIERISAIESKRGIRIQELSNEASLRLMENESLKEEISKKENGVEQKKWQPNLPNKLNTTAL